MEITIEELNILLQREFERGKSSNQTITYMPNTNFDYKSFIPEPCKVCPNHPSNDSDKKGVIYNLREKPKDYDLSDVVEFYEKKNILLIESDKTETKQMTF